LEDRRIEELGARLGVPACELTLRCRRQELLEKRQVVMWYLLEHDGWSSTRVGKVMGYNHATVLNARNTVNRLLSVGDAIMIQLTKIIRDEE